MPSQLPDRQSSGRAVAVYTLLRLLLFAVVAGVAFAAGLRGLALLVLALLASGIASWFLLSGPRARMSEAVDAAARRLRARTEAEDEYVDQVMAESGVIPPDR